MPGPGHLPRPTAGILRDRSRATDSRSIRSLGPRKRGLAGPAADRMPATGTGRSSDSGPGHRKNSVGRSIISTLPPASQSCSSGARRACRWGDRRAERTVCSFVTRCPPCGPVPSSAPPSVTVGRPPCPGAPTRLGRALSNFSEGARCEGRRTSGLCNRARLPPRRQAQHTKLRAIGPAPLHMRPLRHV